MCALIVRAHLSPHGGVQDRTCEVKTWREDAAPALADGIAFPIGDVAPYATNPGDLREAPSRLAARLQARELRGLYP